jgi:hypothetical protein
MKLNNSLETCSVVSTNNGKSHTADILKRSDKSLRVAFQGTDIILTLMRDDVRRPYVGNRAGLEFTTYG